MNPEKYDWQQFAYDLYGLIGYYEIKAVLDGTEAVLEELMPDEPEYNQPEQPYSRGKSRRQVRTYWGLMDKEVKNNMARVILRRYMALTANKMLRKEVFGF